MHNLDGFFVAKLLKLKEGPKESENSQTEQAGGQRKSKSEEKHVKKSQAEAEDAPEPKKKQKEELIAKRMAQVEKSKLK